MRIMKKRRIKTSSGSSVPSASKRGVVVENHPLCTNVSKLNEAKSIGSFIGGGDTVVCEGGRGGG